LLKVNQYIISLLFGLLIITSRNLVILQLIRVLRRGNHPQIITKLLLLQIPLGQILQLTLGESQILRTGDGDLGAVAGDDDIALGEVTGLALDLDAFVEVFFEGGDVEDLVVDGGGAVYDKLDGGLLRGLGFCLKKRIRDIFRCN